MRIILFAALLLLSACGDRLAEREALAGQFIGRSEADLVREGGVPTRTVEAGGRRFLIYEERRVDFMPGSYGPWGYPGPWGGWPYYGGGIPPQAVERVCETTFEIVAGKVAGYSLRGNAC